MNGLILKIDLTLDNVALIISLLHKEKYRLMAQFSEERHDYAKDMVMQQMTSVDNVLKQLMSSSSRKTQNKS